MRGAPVNYQISRVDMFLVAAAGTITAQREYSRTTGSRTLTPSVQADLVARDTLETGQHREGTYFAVMNLVEKCGSGGAVALTGVALGVIGFQPGATQAPEATQALRVLISVLPAALVVLSAAILVGTGRSKARLRNTDRGARNAELVASE